MCFAMFRRSGPPAHLGRDFDSEMKSQVRGGNSCDSLITNLGQDEMGCLL